MPTINIKRSGGTAATHSAAPKITSRAATTHRASVPVGIVAAHPSAPKATSIKPLAPAAKSYSNCTALNRDYPHGVGRPGAIDHVSGKSKAVTDFAVNAAVYSANTGRDRDGDGIACEKH